MLDDGRVGSSDGLEYYNYEPLSGSTAEGCDQVNMAGINEYMKFYSECPLHAELLILSIQHSKSNPIYCIKT